jgi:hypothetical protein
MLDFAQNLEPVTAALEATLQDARGKTDIAILDAFASGQRRKKILCDVPSDQYCRVNMLLLARVLLDMNHHSSKEAIGYLLRPVGDPPASMVTMVEKFTGKPKPTIARTMQQNLSIALKTILITYNAIPGGSNAQ